MNQGTLRAGFAKVDITPPLGSRMHGFHGRDIKHGCDIIRDPLFARALWLEQGDERVLILGFDLLFFDRIQDNRLRGSTGRELGLCSRQILTNCSHTHSGPMTHVWASGMYTPPDSHYLNRLNDLVVQAATQARDAAVPVRMVMGEGTTDMPMSRRLLDESGKAQFLPNPQGTTYDNVPICMVQALDGRPVCLMFSIACHPSSISGFEVSADYPGMAMKLIGEKLGVDCALFLQGCGGDAKARTLVVDGVFRGSPEGADEAGRIVANDVIALLDCGLEEVQPDLATATDTAVCPMAPLPNRAQLEQLAEDKDELKRECAKYQLRILDHGYELPTAIPLTVHGVRLADGVRMVGLEGEAVAELGHVINDFYGSGLTFPLGYTDGCQLYLPTEKVLNEGGYEATSAHEYAWPANFARGIEEPVRQALTRLRKSGI